MSLIKTKLDSKASLFCLSVVESASVMLLMLGLMSFLNSKNIFYELGDAFSLKNKYLLYVILWCIVTICFCKMIDMVRMIIFKKNNYVFVFFYGFVSGCLMILVSDSIDFLFFNRSKYYLNSSFLDTINIMHCIISGFTFFIVNFFLAYVNRRIINLVFVKNNIYNIVDDDRMRKL